MRSLCALLSLLFALSFTVGVAAACAQSDERAALVSDGNSEHAELTTLDANAGTGSAPGAPASAIDDDDDDDEELIASAQPAPAPAAREGVCVARDERGGARSRWLDRLYRPPRSTR